MFGVSCFVDTSTKCPLIMSTVPNTSETINGSVVNVQFTVFDNISSGVCFVVGIIVDESEDFVFNLGRCNILLGGGILFVDSGDLSNVSFVDGERVFSVSLVLLEGLLFTFFS